MKPFDTTWQMPQLEKSGVEHLSWWRRCAYQPKLSSSKNLTPPIYLDVSYASSLRFDRTARNIFGIGGGDVP